ncbi:TPA: alanine--tRNA ligase [Candidatus Campbellbacteria bacterium]|nr:MAG: alanyl-tRNA synthetase, alanyl-tRNA synthetase [Candidatus Campbellbacteria bacterium GW2011_OD1_34_28]KKP75054.1 MAG: Alanine-tRNA ligase [Candidatus Campbellbacteria bacterium GW2011_GWD2_35_24]KKP75940.1 MAG: alanyl-tRNA synthetase, alanyl-tRNA synthetase [Candidatus Campbellbacteria bacterium GW2011_GWC2_35_28]KKP76812.1 MAG: Alanine-tRNA ligase [Candidatus Campbellbacteria bacterium GW2011_GWC1_35_31]KKP78738.1 MAG: Alanine-tRNA ligase [Candidatus Campbellbacteria bacterium GW2011_
MQSNEIRQRFLKFFEKRGHSIIPSASLVPENDPSVLFNTAGMQPLVPYLLGEEHPAGKMIVDAQKCVRTTDIEEVGDNTHLTFFEMLGNWSLGDYFKKDAISWSYEFLTDKNDGLGLDPKKLYVTVFEGNDDAPRDEEAYSIWKNIFVNAGLNPDGHIFFMSAESNWWSPGDNGPCGPDTEMFYSTAGDLGDLTKEEFIKADDEQKIVEIWNDVFMEYEKKDGKVIGKLKQHNVDTGAGLERLATMLQGKTNVYETDGFKSIMNQTKQVSSDKKSQRIIADHLRTSVFIIADGVLPDNHDQGYVLRRILRRAILKTDNKEINAGNVSTLVDSVVDYYGGFYKNLSDKRAEIKQIIEKENEKFSKTLSQGLKQLEKISGDISGKDAFVLSATYGFPIEITEEIAKEKGVFIDIKGYEEEMKKHQELSKTASAGKFKGGLAGDDENSTKLHTATHMLHQALRQVLGDHVVQKGSNITPDRLRFDFSHSDKMTDEEKQKVENIVNEQIQKHLDVKMQEMSVSEAKEKGALGVFDEKYGEKVKVYSVGSFSKEICGGPHIKNTSELGVFKIKKEEASSAGVRRIKAILE